MSKTSPDNAAQSAAPTAHKKFRISSRALRQKLARFTLKRAFTIARGFTKPYEVVEIGGRRIGSKREAQGRWEAIATVLKQYKARSILDIGCAEGWFLRRAATDLGCFALGIEAGDRLFLGETSRLHDNVERMAIMRAMVSPEDIAGLPRCDVVMCLSVVHHVIRAGGVDAAKAFVRALGERAEKAIIFEMGTSDEKGLKWSGVLPEMPEGQEAFVRGLLQSCGLRNIQRMASTQAFHAGAERILFSAEPPPRDHGAR